MSVIAAALRHMLAANMPHEAIVAAVEDMERGLHVDEQAERRRAADRERQRERRLRKSAESAESVDVSDSADAPPPSLDKKAPQTPKELNPSAPASPTPTRGEFDEFWLVFPNKVAKGEAFKAFGKARQRVGFEALMAGLRRYVAKTDDRPWCNPSTWLNQDRWTDEPATVVARPVQRGSPPLRMDDFLGTVIEQQERRNAGPDQEIEGAPQALRAIPGGRWSG